MPVYYIVTNNGFLKQYYSGQNSTSTNDKNNPFLFVASLRKAQLFKSVEEAKVIIHQIGLENCIIINQNGENQES